MFRNANDFGRRCPELPDIGADAKASEKGMRAMTIKEKLEVHRQIEDENRRKLELWKRFEYAKQCLGFYPNDESELQMFECNGYDDGIYAYR